MSLSLGRRSSSDGFSLIFSVTPPTSESTFLVWSSVADVEHPRAMLLQGLPGFGQGVDIERAGERPAFTVTGDGESGCGRRG